MLFISGCTAPVTGPIRSFENWEPVGRLSFLSIFERNVKLQYPGMSTPYSLPYGVQLQIPVIVRLFTHDKDSKLLGAGVVSEDNLPKVLTDALKSEFGKLRYRVVDNQLGGITIDGRIKNFWIEPQQRTLRAPGFPNLRLNGRSEVLIELKESSEGPPVWFNVYSTQNISDEMYLVTESDFQERVDATLKEIVQKIITDRDFHTALRKLQATKSQPPPSPGGYEG